MQTLNTSGTSICYSSSLWAVITSVTYTTNLASFAVAKNTPGPQVTAFDNAAACVTARCVFKKTPELMMHHQKIFKTVILLESQF